MLLIFCLTSSHNRPFLFLPKSLNKSMTEIIDSCDQMIRSEYSFEDYKTRSKMDLDQRSKSESDVKVLFKELREDYLPKKEKNKGNDLESTFNAKHSFREKMLTQTYENLAKRIENLLFNLETIKRGLKYSFYSPEVELLPNLKDFWQSSIINTSLEE